MTDVREFFQRSGEEIILLGQYFSSGELRQEEGECQYVLWVHADSDVQRTIGKIDWPGRYHADSQMGVEHWFGNRMSPKEIRQHLEQVLPSTEFIEWNEFLAAIEARA